MRYFSEKPDFKKHDLLRCEKPDAMSLSVAEATAFEKPVEAETVSLPSQTAESSIAEVESDGDINSVE